VYTDGSSGGAPVVVCGIQANCNTEQLDLRVAAVQKHDPTWGWNRP